MSPYIRNFKLWASRVMTEGAAPVGCRQSSSYNFETSENYFQVKMLDGDRDGKPS